MPDLDDQSLKALTDLVRDAAPKLADLLAGPHAAIALSALGRALLNDAQASAALAERMGVPCQVSLETPMACGLGICFSCVQKIRDESGNWDYRRTCIDGPVFDAASVEF